jgi:UDP-N-acetyl-D-galactosamine dehydrogenase
MVNAGIQPRGARVGVYGLTFKENVTDIRNSRVPDIVNELKEFGAVPLVYDPHANHEEAQHEYGISLSGESDLKLLDAVILAVAHKSFVQQGAGFVSKGLKLPAVVVDVKSVLNPKELDPKLLYWSL